MRARKQHVPSPCFVEHRAAHPVPRTYFAAHPDLEPAGDLLGVRDRWSGERRARWIVARLHTVC
jgi:hypothetical protein